VIADFEMATEAMLRYVVKKTAIKRGQSAAPQSSSSPCRAASPRWKRKRSRTPPPRLARSDVHHHPEEPMAAAHGNQPAGSRSRAGNMIVDIGGGTTEVAMIALAGIVAGQSLRIAGDEMNDAIIRYLRQKYNLLIGLQTAELIKTTIGSAFPLQVETAVEVRGRDIARGIPAMHRVTSEEIRDALAEPIFAIVEAIRRTPGRNSAGAFGRHSATRHCVDRRRRIAQKSGFPTQRRIRHLSVPGR
jgi:rod shape-determining protein MreB and related proteins